MSKPNYAILSLLPCLLVTLTFGIGCGGKETAGKDAGPATGTATAGKDAGPAKEAAQGGVEDAQYLFCLGMKSTGRGFKQMYVLVDRRGKMILDDLEYAQLCQPCEGRMVFESDTQSATTGHFQWGYLDMSGKVAIKPTFDVAGDFACGLACVRGGKWAYIDPNGRGVISYDDFARAAGRKYGATWGFSESLAESGVKIPGPEGALLFDGMLYGYLDKAGKWTIKPQYRLGSPFHEGLAWVADKSRACYINQRGEVVLPFPRDLTTVDISIDPSFYSGRALVMNKQGQCGFIDTSGRVVVPTIYPKGTLARFNGGLAGVSDARGGPWGFMDPSGKKVIAPRFRLPRDDVRGDPSKSVNPFQWIAGACRVTLENGDQALIDTSGKVLWRHALIPTAPGPP